MIHVGGHQCLLLLLKGFKVSMFARHDSAEEKDQGLTILGVLIVKPVVWEVAVLDFHRRNRTLLNFRTTEPWSEAIRLS